MKRDLSIDFLKFCAVIFVVNSHLDICYPAAHRFLATGGAVGGALFFFCSGFTLFLGKDREFSNWCKRRLARIVPSVLLCALFFACWYGPSWYDLVSGFWFVRCILLYYMLLYPIQKYWRDKLWLPFLLVGIGCCIWWCCFEDPHKTIYSGGYFMWGHYFIPMLLGACVGMYRDRLRFRPVTDCVAFLVCVALYLGLWKSGLVLQGFGWMQLVSVPFLSASIYFLYCFANAPIVLKLMDSRVVGWITIIGGLCLEVYLSHRVVVTDGLNYLFPLNIVLILLLAVFLAYIVRCVSRFLVQIVNGTEDFDWYAVFKLK